MNQSIAPLLPLLVLTISVLFVITCIVWLFCDHGLDKLKNSEEWRNVGSSGEQIIFITLRDKIHIPENQILRNVYIPTKDGGTSEIDILVISKKGLLVFECKNYAGNIYGDMKRNKWVQYLGGKKSYFYNPFLQNKSHVKHLTEYLNQYSSLPVKPFVTTISRGKWKVKNLGPEDYFLGYNCHLKDVLETMPESETMMRNFGAIMQQLKPLSRPDESIREEHIEQIKQRSNHS